MTFDGKAFGQEIVAAIKAHVADVLSPINARLDALERQFKALPAPVDLAPEREAIHRVEEAIKAIVIPVVPDVEAIIRDAIATIPTVDPPVIPELPDIPALVAEAMATIPVPKDGKDADSALVRQMVMDEVAKIPPAEPGKSVTVDDLRPLVEEAVGKAISAIPVPKDGCGIRELLIDRDGKLVATMDDGRMKELGIVVGRDGAPGRDGERGADGQPGKDGLDGIGFDDMDMEVREDGIFLNWTKGEIIKEARLPIPFYRGVYSEGGHYFKGNSVTWGGSTWIAEVDEPKGKPDAAGSGWRLCVKKGRDGKDKA